MILIVGGAGYIGSHINKLLNQQGYSTIVLDNLVYGHEEFVKWGQFVLGDIGNIDQIKLLFKKISIEAVINFAAFAYIGESVRDPQKYYLNNVKNTLNLLQVMLENNVKKYIFSSTCATYGIPDKIPITENNSQNPINPYGKSKLMVENILKDYGQAYGLKYAILRYFNAAGADEECEIGEWHQPEPHLIPRILNVAIGRSNDIKIFGVDYDTFDGTCIRDYIHVTDLAKAHLLALEYLLNGGKSEYFNIGNNIGFSVKQVIEEVKRITEKQIKTEESEKRIGDPPILVAGAKKAKEILKWQPQFSELSFIIETAWKWHQKLYKDHIGKD